MKMAHWAHALFWEKKEIHEDYRFCKVCWPDEDVLPGGDEWTTALETGRIRGLYKGCIQNCGSPSAMGNHYIDAAKKVHNTDCICRTTVAQAVRLRAVPP